MVFSRAKLLQRPFFATRIEELECAAHEAAERPAALRAILAELTHRESGRATRLRDEIRRRVELVEGSQSATDDLRRALSRPVELRFDSAAADANGLGVGPAIHAGAPVQRLGLSVRAGHVLEHIGAQTIGDLVALSPEELLRTPNCGRLTIKELESLLKAHGLGFGRPAPAGIIEPEPEHDVPEPAGLDALSHRLSALGLSTRAESFVRVNGLKYAGDLARFAHHEVLRAPNVGRKTAAELRLALQSLDLDFSVELGDWTPEIAASLNARVSSAPAAPNQPDPDSLPEALSALASLTTTSERDLIWTLRKQGWDGGPGYTLEEVGQADGVTRERVRQVVAKTCKAMKRRFNPPSALTNALALALDGAPVSQAQFDAGLRESGLASESFSFTGLRNAAEVFALPFPLSTVRIGETSFLAAPEVAASLPELRRRTTKLIARRGCIYLPSVLGAGKGSAPEPRRDLLRTLLASDQSFSALDADRSWWWRPEKVKTGRNRLVNNIRKVIAAAGSISLGELRNAVRRSHRADLFAPPARILEAICAALPEVQVSEGQVAGRPGHDWSAELSPTEHIMLRILNDAGGALPRTRLFEQAEAAGIGADSLGVATTYSVILWRPAAGVYALVGVPLPPGTIEDLQSEPSPERGALVASHWTKDGKIALAYRLSEASVRSGVVTAPAAFRDFLARGFRILLDGVPEGNVILRTGGLAGLRPVLRASGAESGDALLLVLDSGTAEGEAWVGGPELALTLSRPNGTDTFLQEQASSRQAHVDEPEL